MKTLDRSSGLSPTRRAMLAAGVTTLALSLVISIAPTWAKNAGTVKLHDVATGQLLPDSANDPEVCTFTVVFQFNAPSEIGDWWVTSWAPNADAGTVEVSGTYDTSVNGTDETDPITLAAGHYQLAYRSSGSHSDKTKTFWVAPGCAAPGDPSSDPSNTPEATPAPTAQPTDSPADSPSGDPSSTPDATATTSPSSDPSSDPSDSPGNDPSATPTPTPTATPTATPSSSGLPKEPANDPSATPTATPTATPSSSDLPKEGGVQGETGPSAPPSVTPGGDQTQGRTGGTTSLPNTSIVDTTALTSLLTAIGLLLIIGAHPFIRRSAHADRA